MLYDASTPEEYMGQLEDDWRRETLGQLRGVIKRQAPELEEGINYKMLGYRDERGFVFHLNAQKNYVSLYVGDAEKIDPQRELLKGLNLGKGCIRFTKSVVVAETRIDEFVARAVSLWRDGADLGC